MRKVLIPVAALLLCAAPAAAQQVAAAPEPAAPAQAAEQQAPRTPALYPTTDEVRQQVRANEQRLGHQQAPIGTKDWWYLVAAIAIGVIIAAVLL
jgi:curli biogenesis system outer membrane secretion channel CsgG